VSAVAFLIVKNILLFLKQGIIYFYVTKFLINVTISISNN